MASDKRPAPVYIAAEDGGPVTSGAPARKAAAVVPSDAADLAAPARALYIGGAGDVEVILADDTTSVIFKAHPIGYLPCAVKRVRAAGTTATNILALS